MNLSTKLVLLLGISLLPACSAPHNETETERAERINRGITTGAVLVVVAGIVVLASAADGFVDLVEGE